MMRVFFKAILLPVFSLLLAIPGMAEEKACPTILTVTGNITEPNRGGYDPDIDKFFGYTEVEFDKARSFNCMDLKALPIVTVKADFPKGRQEHTYSGPTLESILKAAGAAGKTVTVQALDGYAMQADYATWVKKSAVVALMRDGVPFGIGDFGPSQIVFARAERDDLKDMEDDLWVWSIFHIAVE